VDRLAPPAPAVSGRTGSAGPEWTWAAANGSDGARIFRYRLAAEAAWSAETGATAYAPTGLGAGTFTLEVQERDAAGNWSAAGSAAATGP
jgi:hypothetical protein